MWLQIGFPNSTATAQITFSSVKLHPSLSELGWCWNLCCSGILHPLKMRGTGGQVYHNISNYHSTPCDIPEEKRSNLHRSRSLKLHVVCSCSLSNEILLQKFNKFYASKNVCILWKIYFHAVHAFEVILCSSYWHLLDVWPITRSQNVTVFTMIPT